MTIRIKICGVTTPEDAVAIVDAGADFIGLNFSAQSARCIARTTARTIVEAVPGFGNRFAGVFVEQTWDELAAINAELNLSFFQAYTAPWPAERPHAPFHIAAFRVRSADNIAEIRTHLAAPGSPDLLLIDSFVPGAMGGTGHKAPWELLAGQDFGVPLILAGGLTPDNVADAIRIVKPWGVDVASGVETSPGRKDAGKVRAFIRAVRDAERAL